MTEFIGSRISLISKRDIRYVGTLHEINSENSTVALEHVVSHGTEGRRPDAEVLPSLDNVYEYIVFRGSDVKDLRIEEGPKDPAPPKPPAVPDDPAILGSTRRDTPGGPPQQHQQPGGGPPPPSGPYGHPPQHPDHLPPHLRFGGPQGPPFPSGPPGPPGPGHNFPGAPYGAPPGWYPPYGYPSPSGPYPTRGPGGPFGQGPPPGQPGAVGAPPGPGGAAATEADGRPSSARGTGGPLPTTVKLPDATGTPPLPRGSAAEAPPAKTAAGTAASQARGKAESQAASSTAEKGNRFVPAVPLQGSSGKDKPINGGNKAQPTFAEKAAMANKQSEAPAPAKSFEDANRDARAAVAAAMAKLPGVPSGAQANGGVDQTTRRLNEVRLGEQRRGPRGGQEAGPRGGRGGHRVPREPARKAELPKSDYDFESANAKFNKQDLIKEAIATGPGAASPTTAESAGEEPEAESETPNQDVEISGGGGSFYNRTSSFFDDISSEIKDRGEPGSQNAHPGRRFREEERQKNVETFGQGSVDSGFRRGRGRGRGRGGYYGRGRGYRGGHDGRRGGPRGGGPVAVDGI